MHTVVLTSTRKRQAAHRHCLTEANVKVATAALSTGAEQRPRTATRDWRSQH